MPRQNPDASTASDVSAREDQTILEVARETGICDPDALPPRRPLRRRRLPALPGRGQRQSRACSPPASPASPRAWRSPPTPTRLDEYRRDDPRAALRRAQPRLLGLRGQRPLRAARRWPSTLGMTTSASPTSTRACRWTPRTSASASTTTAASSARAACASATRSKARTPGTCWPRRRLPRHHRPEPALGRLRNLHHLRQVRAGLPDRRALPRRARRSPRCPSAASSCRISRSCGREAMTTSKVRLATVWLGGCSGCHMSFLDLDEWLHRPGRSRSTSSTAR